MSGSPENKENVLLPIGSTRGQPSSGSCDGIKLFFGFEVFEATEWSTPVGTTVGQAGAPAPRGPSRTCRPLRTPPNEFIPLAVGEKGLHTFFCGDFAVGKQQLRL